MSSSGLAFQEGCPQCGTATNLLHVIDQGMKLRLEKEGTIVAFEQVCTSCFKTLSKTLSNASYLAAEQIIQKNFKNNLWKNRLNLIRHARNLLGLREYAEAAVCYEKYLKVVEYIYEKKRPEWTAGMFKEHPREVTIIAGALWSLVEIYDLHPTYWKKQEDAAAKLGELLSYTNLFASIIKRASLKRKHAKNKKAYKMLLKAAHVSHGHCFVAAVAYPDRHHPTQKILRRFRGEVLMLSPLGRQFVRVYYRWSPGLANSLQHNTVARWAVRQALRAPVRGLKIYFQRKDRTKNISTKS